MMINLLGKQYAKNRPTPNAVTINPLAALLCFMTISPVRGLPQHHLRSEFPAK
jgi:hypothetical protein